MSTVMRPRKDGGYSECSSPDELVGRGRCCHILDGDKPVMDIEKMGRGLYEVRVCDSKLSIKAQKQAIVNFFDSLDKIDEAKQQEIINFINA